jgi:hypothetical protein
MHILIDFRISQLIIFDVHFVLVCLHLVDVGRLADLSEVHDASFFKIEVSRMSEYSCR